MRTTDTAAAVLAASVLALLGSARLSAQVPRPTPAQLRAFENVKRLDVQLALDHDEYLPRERARISLTVRNPTGEPLQVPVPFHQMTGSFYIMTKVINPDAPSESPGDEEYDPPENASFGFPIVRWDVPTTILSPGQEVTQSVYSDDTGPAPWTGPVRIPTDPGRYRLKYGYGQRMHADFRVVSPTRLCAVSLVHLPPVEIIDAETRRPAMRGSVVPFLVIETTPGVYWLFRGDPLFREAFSPYPFAEYNLRVLDRLGRFERVQRVDEAVTSLRTELHADETVDLIAGTAGNHQTVLHAPAKPARPADLPMVR
jgi:hypothetical protein